LINTKRIAARRKTPKGFITGNGGIRSKDKEGLHCRDLERLH
jgi:hypothetical protein